MDSKVQSPKPQDRSPQSPQKEPPKRDNFFPGRGMDGSETVSERVPTPTKPPKKG